MSQTKPVMFLLCFGITVLGCIANETHESSPNTERDAYTPTIIHAAGNIGQIGIITTNGNTDGCVGIIFANAMKFNEGGSVSIKGDREEDGHSKIAIITTNGRPDGRVGIITTNGFEFDKETSIRIIPSRGSEIGIITTNGAKNGKVGIITKSGLRFDEGSKVSIIYPTGRSVKSNGRIGIIKRRSKLQTKNRKKNDRIGIITTNGIEFDNSTRRLGDMLV